MAVHTYSLRTRVNSPAISVKTPTHSPLTRIGSRSPRKPSLQPSILQLKHVIGTTTSSPSGLSCCQLTNSFAYCAGAVAVLATVDNDGSTTYRYFKAKPTAIALNSSTSYFDAIGSNNTPTKRKSIITPKRGFDENSANGFGREWLDDANGQTWSARERIKAVSCVCISPDGKFLAVGETGYNPRVLIFSIANNMSSEQPLSIAIDHTIGVRCVAFSPDSKFLATLGDVNDGFLHVWSINPKTADMKLHSTNKCTTNVCDMTWIGNNIVTVGTRHIKIWQIAPSGRSLTKRSSRLRLDDATISSPGPCPLQGRNCLLGKMSDVTFTAIAPVSKDLAVVCADDGHICKLDLSEGRADLSSVDTTYRPVAALCFRTSSQQVMWPGTIGALQVHDVCQWHQSRDKSSPDGQEGPPLRQRHTRHSLLRESLGISQVKKPDVVALGNLAHFIVSVDADGNIKLLHPDGQIVESVSERLSSHHDLVKGIQTLPSDDDSGSFFTWSRNGEVRFWTSEGELTRSEQCELDELVAEDSIGTNELRVVRYLPDRRHFIICDRYGVLKLIERDTWREVQTVRAHSAEVTDLVTHHQSALLASCSRDRMVQLFRFRERQLDLIQTLDEHISAVQHVCFSDCGHRLLSCSTDRTVIVREKMERNINGEILTAYLSARVITLKASPLSMALMPQDQNTLIVSTMDRHMVRVDIATGAVLEAFKVADKDTDDTSILNAICLSAVQGEDERPIVAGYSSIDKSIRVYDLQKGVLLGREAGHTEGISDLALLESVGVDESSVQRLVVSTGVDSTIMIWSLNSPMQPLLTPLQELSQSQALQWQDDHTPIKASPASLPPLRKVLSKMDIAEFMRQTSSSSRESSPHTLRRKTSRLAISTPIEENEEATSSGDISRARSRERVPLPVKRSPSPPTRAMRPQKQRSRTEMGRDGDYRRNEWLRRSPSPPPVSASTPATPKYQRANNGRLRRPPSVPADLRAQAALQQRRQSMSSANDFGSIGMASEQACRMLKTYRKKVQQHRSDLDLDEVLHELEATLDVIRYKKKKSPDRDSDVHVRSPTSLDTEVDRLAILMEKTIVE